MTCTHANVSKSKAGDDGLSPHYAIRRLEADDDSTITDARIDGRSFLNQIGQGFSGSSVLIIVGSNFISL